MRRILGGREGFFLSVPRQTDVSSAAATTTATTTTTIHISSISSSSSSSSSRLEAGFANAMRRPR